MRSLRWVLLLLTVVGSLMALTPDQQRWLRDHPGQTPNWVTSDEAKNPPTRDFTPTDPPPTPVRNVAEFEPATGALVRYNYGLDIPTSLVALMSQQVTVVTIISSSSQITTARSEYQAAGANLDHCVFMIDATDTEWTRDYGPMFVFDGDDEMAVIDFPYNRPRPLDDAIPVDYADWDTLSWYGMNVTTTGGNYMSDGLGQAVSTDLVWEENTDLTHAQINQYMQNYLGITDYHVVEDPLGEYIKHVDCWGKYLGVDKILIGQVPTSDSRYQNYEDAASYFASVTDSWGSPLKVYRVFTPGGNQVTPYTNSLILNNHVYVPQSGNSNDAAALTSYQAAMPGYTIHGVSYSGWYNTDALHCRVHELPDKHMLYVYHMPVQNQSVSQDVNIDATIHPYSGATLYPDSLRVYYKVDNATEWTSLPMTDQGNETYRATIPAQPEGSTVRYYIYTADHSGRHTMHPLIGAPDPHVFTVLDTEPPVATFDPIPNLTHDQMPYQITATATDNVGVSSVSLQYWTTDPAQVSSLDFTHGEGDLWEATITANMFTAGDTVRYRLLTIDNSNNQTWLPADGNLSFVYDPVSVGDQTLPAVTLNLFPNPFSTQGLNIAYSLPKAQLTEVVIYNVKGQKVKTLQSGQSVAGTHTLRWDGTDENGHRAASGVYFCRIHSGEQILARKVLMLK